MKVNLSYSVKITQVLAEVEKIYEEQRKKFEKDYNLATSLLERPFLNPSVETNLHTLEAMRQGLADFETKLVEVQGILRGYRSILEGGKPSPEPPAMPEIDPQPEAQDE